MKKGILFSLLLLMFVLVGSAYAIDDPSVGPQAMAQYFPEETVFFAALRTDSGYIDALDGVIARVLAGLPEVPPVSLRQALDEGLINAGVSLDEIYAWLGDYAAVGVVDIATFSGEQPAAGNDAYFVAEITDRAAAEAFFENDIPDFQSNGYEASTVGDFTLYASEETEGIIAINDSLLLIGADATLLDSFPVESTLSADADFSAAVADMPAPAYNIFLYTSAAVFEAVPNVDQLTGYAPAASATGLTILDDRSLTIDSVRLAGLGVEPVDPEFLRFIPSDSSAVILATNLSGLINGALDSARAAMPEDNDAPDPAVQLSGAFGFLGIDLEADLLSWATGDYAIFGRANVQNLFEGVASGDVEIIENVDFGFIIEATDPAGASTLATKLGAALANFTENNEDVAVTETEIGGFGATVITLSAEAFANPINFQIAIGATDDVFYIASRNAADVITSGSGDLLNNPAVAEASAYILPQSSVILYADSDGLLLSTVVPLGLMGPSIGNVFDNVTEGLESGAVPAIPNTLSVRAQGGDGMEQAAALLDWFSGTFTSSSISVAESASGNTLARAVLTLAE